MKSLGILVLILLLYGQAGHIAAQNRNDGREVLQTRIVSIDHFTRVGTTAFGSVFEIRVTAEYWNPAPDTVYITHNSNCNDQILVIPDFDNPSLLFQQQPVTCDQTITEFAYNTGVGDQSFTYTFSLTNYFEQSLPVGSILLSYNLGQDAIHTFNSTIVISNGEWQAEHDVYTENWGELPDTLTGFIIWVLLGFVAFVLFLVIRAKPWMKKEAI